MAAKRRDSDILIARESGVLTLRDGSEAVIIAGVTRARRGSEVVESAPDWWKPIDVHYDVEQATAAPGERRGG